MAENTVKEMTTNFGKLDKFEGHDFRRWQKKMHFLLTTLKVVYVLTTPMPELLEDATVEAIRIKAKWENDDYICRGHILNGMSDSLFDVYTNVESAKELWDSLESKYMEEDSSSKKFLKDFKHTLKHGKDDLSLVQLGSHLRIEESLRAQDNDKGKGKEVAGPSVNMAEESKNKNNKQNKGKKRDFKEHSSGSGSNKKQVGMLEVWTIPKTKVDAIAWWIDSGATTHVCKDRCWFKTYEPVEDGSVLYMGDDHFAPVHGKGSVKKAIDDEIGSIMENNIWILSDLPPGCKPLGCKWIFKRKMKVDGTIDKFKARLVIQGFRQKEGIDYFDTYAPVARITTIRLLLALAAIHNLVIHQMDVKTTFLNGDLDEEVYMKQPEGFVMSGNEHNVC
ncbi:zinc finger, CCHC-type containing protein [Tanacetum coccineum]